MTGEKRRVPRSDSGSQDFVTIARIVKTRGLRGEVAAAILTDFPERFEKLEIVRVFIGGVGHHLKLERHWFHKGRVILKFEGLGRPEQSAYLVGGEVQVPEQERVEPPKGFYFHSDLIGCRLFQAGGEVGEVIDVFETGGAAANLVVRTVEGGEAMVPLASHFILKVDVRNKTISARLPSQLLELDRSGRRRETGPRRGRNGKKTRRKTKPR